MGIESKDAGKPQETGRHMDEARQKGDEAARQTERDTRAHQGDVAKEAQRQQPSR
jgi:hypothetical protein